MRARWVICAVLVPLLVAVGCGGGSDDDDDGAAGAGGSGQEESTTTSEATTDETTEDTTTDETTTDETTGDADADQETVDRAIQAVVDDLLAAGFEQGESDDSDSDIEFDTESCDPYEVLFNDVQPDGTTAFADQGGSITKANPDGSQEVVALQAVVLGADADVDAFYELLEADDLLPCLEEGLGLLFAQIDLEIDELDLNPSPVDDIGEGYVGVDGVGVLSSAGQSAPFGFTMGIGEADRLVGFGLMLVLGTEVPSIDSSELVGRMLDAAAG